MQPHGVRFTAIRYADTFSSLELKITDVRYILLSSPAILTDSRRLWLQRHGVWDAPQGQSPRWVSLNEQLVEGFSSAVEEACHGWTNQELGRQIKTKQVSVWKPNLQPKIHQTNYIFCGFAFWLSLFKQKQHTTNCMKTKPRIPVLSWISDSSSGHINH